MSLFGPLTNQDGTFCFCDQCDGQIVSWATYYRHLSNGESEEEAEHEFDDDSGQEEQDEENAENEEKNEENQFLNNSLELLLAVADSEAAAVNDKFVSELVLKLLKCHVQFSGKQEMMSSLLVLFKELLSKAGVDKSIVSQIPLSFRQAVSFVHHLCGPMVKLDVCVGCEEHLFRDKAPVCPKCAHSRYGKDKRPNATFVHFPLIPRLQRYYSQKVYSFSNLISVLSIFLQSFSQLVLNNTTCNKGVGL